MSAEHSPLPLTGRRALVLGAGSPEGRAVAVALAEAGADVAVATASLDGNEVMACRRTRRAVEAAGRRSAEYAFDVTLGQNVQVSTRQVSKDLGGLDTLVWAVAVPTGGPADKLSDAEWSRALAVNLSGAFFACRAVLREMLPAGHGSILLLAGAAGPTPSDLPLTVARHGLTGLARALAVEYGDRGVRAFALHLGPPSADTPSLSALAVHLATGDPTYQNGNLFQAALPA